MSVYVVGCYVENLFKLSQGFGETTKADVGTRVLREQVNVAGVELLGFVEIGVALLPIASPPFDIGESLRNPTVIGQKAMCLLKVIHCGVVVLKAGVVIKALGQNCLAKIGLQSKSRFRGVPRFFAESDGWLKTLCEVATRIDVGQQRPTKRELRVQLHCFFEVFLRAKGVRRCESSL